MPQCCEEKGVHWHRQCEERRSALDNVIDAMTNESSNNLSESQLGDSEWHSDWKSRLNLDLVTKTLKLAGLDVLTQIVSQQFPIHSQHYLVDDAVVWSLKVIGYRKDFHCTQGFSQSQPAFRPEPLATLAHYYSVLLMPQ